MNKSAFDRKEAFTKEITHLKNSFNLENQNHVNKITEAKEQNQILTENFIQVSEENENQKQVISTSTRIGFSEKRRSFSSTAH
jgi:hypothetical protein